MLTTYIPEEKPLTYILENLVRMGDNPLDAKNYLGVVQITYFTQRKELFDVMEALPSGGSANLLELAILENKNKTFNLILEVVKEDGNIERELTRKNPGHKGNLLHVAAFYGNTKAIFVIRSFAPASLHKSLLTQQAGNAATPAQIVVQTNHNNGKELLDELFKFTNDSFRWMDLIETPGAKSSNLLEYAIANKAYSLMVYILDVAGTESVWLMREWMEKKDDSKPLWVYVYFYMRIKSSPKDFAKEGP